MSFKNGTTGDEDSCQPTLKRITRSDEGPYHACLQLRYAYFVTEKGWVGDIAACSAIEMDRYDGHALHLGIFLGAALVGYLRALPWMEGTGFMLEKEFADLLLAEELNVLERMKALEVSRLVISPLCPKHLCQTAMELLLRELYHLCKELEKPIVYMVVEETWLPAFVRRFRLPLKRIGRCHTFPDGTRTVAAVADVRELERLYAENYPEKFAWYQRR